MRGRALRAGVSECVHVRPQPEAPPQAQLRHGERARGTL